MKWKKVYVKVIIEQDSEGNIRPMSIVWTDGHTYEVDRLKQKCRAASLKVGGTGIRYTVMICGKETYLWLEKGRRLTKYEMWTHSTFSS